MNPGELYDRLDDFKDGYRSWGGAASIPPTALVEATNVELTEVNKIRTRPGTVSYGQTLTTPIDGAGEFTETDSEGVTTRGIWVVDNGVFKVSYDGGNWTTVSGATFTVGHFVDGEQLRDKLYLSNSVDSIRVYDVSTGALTDYETIDAPATPTATLSGLTSGSYAYSYIITGYNNIGETVGSTAVNTTANLQRSSWGGSNFVTLSWTAHTDTDIEGYIIYIKEAGGLYYKLAEVPGRTVTSFKDDGSLVINNLVEEPLDNTTGGPILVSLSKIDNRIWGVDRLGAVYWTGTGNNVGKFSPFYDGGYTYLEKGSSEKPIKAVGYKDGKGNQAVTVFTTNASGSGSIWHITLTPTAIGDFVVNVPVAVKIPGGVGSNSPRAIIQVDNSVYYVSRKGFFVLGPKPSIVNSLSTDEISLSIRPDVYSLSQEKLKSACAINHEGRILFSINNGVQDNNEIWTFDLERNRWMLRWTIGVKKFFEYTDSANNTHLLAIHPEHAKLIKFTRSARSTDLGKKFECIARTGYRYFTKDRTTFGRPQRLFLETSMVNGKVKGSLMGYVRNKGLATVKTLTISNNIASNIGFSTQLFSAHRYSNPQEAPQNGANNAYIRKRSPRQGRLLNFWQGEIRSDTAGADWTVVAIGIEGGQLENFAHDKSWVI